MTDPSHNRISNLNDNCNRTVFEFRVPYSQRYLFNAIPDTNDNANPTTLTVTVGVILTLPTLLILIQRYPGLAPS